MSDQERSRHDLPNGLSLPAHERLMENATEFSDFYVTTAPCSPSRSVFYTGMHTKFTEVTGNPGIMGAKYLDPEMATVGDMLRKEGYYTAYKGKWHLGSLDEFYALPSADVGARPTAYPVRTHAMEQFGFSDYNLTGDNWGNAWGGFNGDAEIADEASRWLLEKAPQVGESRPWMLSVNFVNPHDIMFFASGEHQKNTRAFQNLLTPIREAPLAGPYADDLGFPLPESLMRADLSNKPWLHSCFRDLSDMVFGQIRPDDHEAWARFQNYYFNCLRDMDTHLSQVLNALEASGEAERTVIVYTSDHGEMAGAHGLREKGPFMYKENVRVPLIVKHPDLKESRQVKAIGSSLDIAPTLLAIAGVDDERMKSEYSELKGCNLMPAIAGGKSERDERGMLFYFGQVVWLDPDLSRIALENGDKSIVELMGILIKNGYAIPTPKSYRKNQMRGIFDGRYKFGRYFSMKEHNRPESLADLLKHNERELYDTHTDPHELNNLAIDTAANKELIIKMNTLLNEAIKKEIGVDDGSELPGSKYVS